MITEQDLQEAIAECQGQRNPTSSTCIKLAAFLTIKQHLYPEPEKEQTHTPISMLPSYSYADVEPVNEVEWVSDSEFAQAVRGKPKNEVWQIIDELMSTLQVLQPRLYDSIIRRVDGL